MPEKVQRCKMLSADRKLFRRMQQKIRDEIMRVFGKLTLRNDAGDMNQEFVRQKIGSDIRNDLELWAQAQEVAANLLKKLEHTDSLCRRISRSISTFWRRVR